MTDDRPVLHVPARDIPIPTSVSAEAQAVLTMPAMQSPEYPPLDDLDAWREMIAEYDKTVGAMVGARAADAPVDTVEFDGGGFPVYDIRPHRSRRTTSASTSTSMAAPSSRRWRGLPGNGDRRGRPRGHTGLGGRLPHAARPPVPVRPRRRPEDLPPPARGPPARVHRVGGASAGGNLAAAVILHARDEGLPLPGAVGAEHPCCRPDAVERLAAHQPGSRSALDPKWWSRVDVVRRRSRPHRPLPVAGVR